MVVIDCGGVVRWVNLRAAELIGCASGEVPEGSAVLVPPVNRDGGLTPLPQQIAASDSPWQGELLLKRPAGPDIPARWAVAAIPSAAGQLQEFVCTHRQDAAAPRAAGIGEDQDAERFRMPLDFLARVVILHRLTYGADGEPLDYTFEDVNRTFEEHANKRRADVLHRLATDVWETPNPPYLKEYAIVVRTQTPMEFETYFPVTGRYYMVSVFPLGADLFATTAADITERKRMEEALRREKAFTDAVLDSVPGMLYVYDAGGHLIRWNKQHEEMTGYSAAELDHMYVLDWYDEQWKPLIAEGVRRTLEDGRASAEAVLKKKSGEGMPILVTAVRMTIGGQVYFTGIGIDLTERRRAEQDRAYLESQLAQAQKLESVGKLAGGIAHDFNNLLTVINGYSGCLLEDLSEGDPLREYAAAIGQAGERAASLTRQLLAFSRRQVIEPKPLDLNAVVRDIASMLGRLIGEDIEVVTALDESLGMALADPGQIHQVLMNLIVNARDAMPEGGTLTVQTSDADFVEDELKANPEALPGPYVRLSVADSGIGMDEATRRQVFEPFFTTKSKDKGTGLGLSTVYGIVRQSGGWIAVRSEPGRGSLFEVYLPRVKAVPLPEQRTAPVAALPVGTETILIVEDQGGVRNLAKKILSSRGYRTLEAADGIQAQRLAAEHAGPIHLMITDVVLPGMNGRQLADTLTGSRPEMKVLYISGYTANVIVHRGVLDPGVAYLPKPFTADELAAKVRAVLGG